MSVSPWVCLSLRLSLPAPVSPPPGLLQPYHTSVIGANLKYCHYSEGSELKRKEAQEEEKDEALGSSLLSPLTIPSLFFSSSLCR